MRVYWNCLSCGEPRWVDVDSSKCDECLEKEEFIESVQRSKHNYDLNDR